MNTCRYLIKAYRLNGCPVFFRREEAPRFGSFNECPSIATDFGSQSSALAAIPEIKAIWRGLNTFTVAIDSGGLEHVALGERMRIPNYLAH